MVTEKRSKGHEFLSPVCRDVGFAEFDGDDTFPIQSFAEKVLGRSPIFKGFPVGEGPGDDYR